MPESYNAAERTRYTLEEAEDAVGKRATLTLTGKIVRAGESPSGAYVKFEVDERWGFEPGYGFVMDLECFEMLND